MDRNEIVTKGGAYVTGGVDHDKFITIELPRSNALLHYNDVKRDIDHYEQFIKEKASCTKYRIIATIRPYMTNVLLNPYTEIVRIDENSAKIIIQPGENFDGQFRNVNGKQTPNKEDMIQNTEYSHPEHGGCIYLPGHDIFDNHLLRNTGFSVITTNNGRNRNVFNTISDYARNEDGSVVKIAVREDVNNVTDKERHLYRIGDIMSYEDSRENNLVEENGWFGFMNASTLKTTYAPSSGAAQRQETWWNCVDNSKNPCDFIDMYPGRREFSMIPQVNPITNETETNWDFVLTYPSSHYRDGNIINESIGAVAVVWSLTVTEGQNSMLLYMRTPFAHNLERGDEIKLYIYKTNDNGDSGYVELNEDEHFTVAGVGNTSGEYPDIYFFVRIYQDAENTDDVIFTEGGHGAFFTGGGNTQTRNVLLRYKKVVNGNECDYYIRRFKQVDDKTLSENYRLSFAKSIYDDNILQITFTDTVNVDGIKDNRGRPVTSLYLTAIKKASSAPDYDGYKNDHSLCRCFGPLSYGFDYAQTSVDATLNKFNEASEHLRDVHYIIHDDKDDAPIQDADSKEYMGDLVEYSPYTDTETILCGVCYRFNTMQREYLFGDDQPKITYHEISADDEVNEDGTLSQGFHADPRTEVVNTKHEGYYYRPHHQIQIRQFGELQSGKHREMSVIEAHPVASDSVYVSVRTRAPHRLSVGDTVILRLSNTNQYTNFHVTSVENSVRFGIRPYDGRWAFKKDGSDNITTYTWISLCKYLSSDIPSLTYKICGALWEKYMDPDVDDRSKYYRYWQYIKSGLYFDSGMEESIKDLGYSDDFNDLRNASNVLFLAQNKDIPDYATQTGPNSYVWHEIYSNGDDRATGIPDYTFANGAIYLTPNFGLYLQRQDPEGISQLNDGKTPPDIMGDIMDKSNYEYIEEIDTTC